MPRPSKLGAVILAAGGSRRMGLDKALLALPTGLGGEEGDTLVVSAVNRFHQICDIVVVVGGENAPALRAARLAATLVVNPDPSRGQFSSLQIGLLELAKHNCDAGWITLVDCPAPALATLRALRDEFAAAADAIWAVVPEYKGEHGHPYLAGSSLIDKLLEAPANASAREIRRRYQRHVRYLAVDDPRVVVNLNTPRDYQRFGGTAVKS